MNYATIDKVEKGFSAVSDKLSDYDDKINALAEQAKVDRKQLKAFGASVLDSSMQAGNYTGFWGSEQQAKEFGCFCLAAVGKQVDKSLDFVSKALDSLQIVDGAALVPDEYQARLVRQLGLFGVYRRNAAVYPMTRDHQMWPRVTDGVTVYKVGQGQTITPSDIRFGMLGLTCWKMAALTVISNELDSDAALAVGEIVGSSMAREFAKKEDVLGFSGDGTSDYFGVTGIVQAFLNIDADPSNAAGVYFQETAGAYSAITLEDILALIGLLPDEADAGAKFFCNKKFYHQVLMNLAAEAGLAKIAEILAGTKQRTFYGYPVEFVPSMPFTPTGAAADHIPLILGDLSMGAFLGDRRQMTVESSRDAYFTTDQLGIRAIERIDFNNSYGVGTTSDVGPIVALMNDIA